MDQVLVILVLTDDPPSFLGIEIAAFVSNLILFTHLTGDLSTL